MKIICSGPNYTNHFENDALPLEPQFFVKTENSIAHHLQEIIIPSYASYLLGEAELVLVIAKETYKVSENQAKDYVSHFTVANDLTATETTNTDMQWFRAKCADGFCPIGSLIPGFPPDDLNLQSYLNGKLVQDFSTAEMVFKPSFLLSYISQFITLKKGDLILTGAKKGAFTIKKGDTAQVTLAHLTYCKNSFQ